MAEEGSTPFKLDNQLFGSNNCLFHVWSQYILPSMDCSCSQVCFLVKIPNHLKRQLQTLQQGTKTCTEYLNLAKQLADQLSAAGEPVEDDDLISYVLGGLSSSFNTFVTVHSFTTQDKELSFANFQSELLNHEMLLENQQQQNVSRDTETFAFYNNKTG